jgi:hypothetical protein
VGGNDEDDAKIVRFIAPRPPPAHETEHVQDEGVSGVRVEHGAYDGYNYNPGS